jgi:hypothetical protein
MVTPPTPGVIAVPPSPVLAIVQTRDRRLEVRMVDRVPCFTVYGDNGRLLAANLSAQALAKAFPALEEAFRYGAGALLADE